MGELLSIAAVVLALVSIAVALWQGFISRSQLRLAQDTEKRTERALEEIRSKSAETRLIAEDIKTNLVQQINRVLESKIQGEANSQQMSAKIMEGLFSGAFKKPEEGS